MTERFEVAFPVLGGSEERFTYIYLPNSYFHNENKRYPVLYMFDGHNVFFDEDATYGKSWGMAKFAEENKLPLIIAAVECNHSPDNGRLSEYSPFTFDNSQLGRIKGRGHITMKWFVNKFKPYIDKHFPTIPNRKHTFIAGSSMGGLMSLYAVMRYNHVFSRAAALSPSIWFATAQLDNMLSHAHIRKDTVVYMDYGSREMGAHWNMKWQFNRVASKLLERGVMLDCRVVPNGDHDEATWEKQIPFFMSTLFYDL